MVQRDQTLPLRVWLARLTNDTERRSKASLCNNGLLFLLCGGLRNYESIKTACRRGRKTHYWRVERKNSALLISNSTTSKRLLQVRWYFVYILPSIRYFDGAMHEREFRMPKKDKLCATYCKTTDICSIHQIRILEYTWQLGCYRVALTKVALANFEHDCMYCWEILNIHCCCI